MDTGDKQTLSRNCRLMSTFISVATFPKFNNAIFHPSLDPDMENIKLIPSTGTKLAPGMNCK